jgi:hypothetical protein
VRALAGSLVSDKEANPQLAALALNDMLQVPRNWEQLSGMDNHLTALALLRHNPNGDLIEGIRILNALGAYNFRTPTSVPKDLEPLLRSLDRNKRVFALEHIEYDSLDRFEKYLQTSDRDLEEDGLAGESFLRFALNHAQTTEAVDSAPALAKQIQQDKARFDRMAEAFHAPNARARFETGVSELYAKLLDEVRRLVVQGASQWLFELLDAARPIARQKYEQRQLELLRARLLWDGQRGSALDVLRILEKVDDLYPLDVSLVTKDPGLRDELIRNDLPRLVRALDNTGQGSA